ncbi:MAG: FAD-binding dehydrogenase, partial [bacterium]|nr:FAD-binding dehydrogenase [bacterium]
STRVQATLGEAAQAVGLAAALCLRDSLLPAAIGKSPRIHELQESLLKRGQFIPEVADKNTQNLAHSAVTSASSRLRLSELPADGPLLPLTKSWAQMLPVGIGPVPKLTFTINVEKATTLQLELRSSDRPSNFTPDVTLGNKAIELAPGENQALVADFDISVAEPRYLFFCLMQNPGVVVHCSEQRVTGVLSVSNGQNPAVSNYGKQEVEQDLGVESFEFWCPERRPAGQNLAFTVEPALDLFGPDNLFNGRGRPTFGPNAWVADVNDTRPILYLEWKKPQTISQMCLTFDTDFDHPMESVQYGHPEGPMPFCVKQYRITNAEGTILAEERNNHQSRNWITFEAPVTTTNLAVEILESHGDVPAALFEVACYAERKDLIK